MHDTPFRNFRKNQWKWPQANVNYTWYCFHLDTTVPFLSPEKHATWWNFSSKRLLWELHWLQQSSFFLLALILWSDLVQSRQNLHQHGVLLCLGSWEKVSSLWSWRGASKSSSQCCSFSQREWIFTFLSEFPSSVTE